MIIGACALALVGCASMEDEDKTDVIGSRLEQPPVGAPRPVPAEAGDIAIAGQEVAHSLMDLPVVANATVPPLVQFKGVTSIINPPIDTAPYTILLRDRLLLITREKLRFVEHTLPPYIPGKKRRSSESQPSQNTTNYDYQILAELRGRANADYYKIQVEFVDAHTGDVLFNGLYRIRPEASDESAPEPATTSESQSMQIPDQSLPPPPQQTAPPPAPGNGTNPIY